MDKRHLKMLVTVFVLISGLSACGGGAGNLPASNSVSNPSSSATSALLRQKTSAITTKALAPSAAHSGYGPRVAVGPQPSITCAPSSVNLTPGQNVNSIVASHAPGTAYCFSPGTYAEQTIQPHQNDSFIGVKGAILNGENSTQYAFSTIGFYSGGAETNVTIKNLTITNYNAPAQSSPINVMSNSTGWQIRNDEFAYSGALGITGITSWNIAGNYIHDNAQGGYGLFGSSIAFTDNEIAHNDPNNAYDLNINGTGGGKAYATTNINVSYNYSHDNTGAGLWTDGDNQGTTYTYNDLENNTRNGIMHEVSWDAVIQNNYFNGNGSLSACQSAGQIFCGGIFISSSGGESGKIIDISKNYIIQNSYGAAISLLTWPRGSGIYGTHLVENVHVHNNTVDLSAPGSTFGAADRGGADPAMFTSQGNSFNYDYFVGVGKNSSFYWGSGNVYGVFSNFPGLQAKGEEYFGGYN